MAAKKAGDARRGVACLLIQNSCNSFLTVVFIFFCLFAFVLFCGGFSSYR